MEGVRRLAGQAARRVTPGAGLALGVERAAAAAVYAGEPLGRAVEAARPTVFVVGTGLAAGARAPGAAGAAVPGAEALAAAAQGRIPRTGVTGVAAALRDRTRAAGPLDAERSGPAKIALDARDTGPEGGVAAAPDRDTIDAVHPAIGRLITGNAGPTIADLSRAAARRRARAGPPLAGRVVGGAAAAAVRGARVLERVSALVFGAIQGARVRPTDGGVHGIEDGPGVVSRGLARATPDREQPRDREQQQQQRGRKNTGADPHRRPRSVGLAVCQGVVSGIIAKPQVILHRPTRSGATSATEARTARTRWGPSAPLQGGLREGGFIGQLFQLAPFERRDTLSPLNILCPWLGRKHVRATGTLRHDR